MLREEIEAYSPRNVQYIYAEEAFLTGFQVLARCVRLEENQKAPELPGVLELFSECLASLISNVCFAVVAGPESLNTPWSIW